MPTRASATPKRLRPCRRALLATAALIVASAVHAESSTDPLAKAARGFYDVYMTLHPSDGIPDGAERTKFAPYVSPALDQLFAEGDQAEHRYVAATKNQAPPLIEGDPFTPNFEGATSYRLGACAYDNQGGHCAVSLTYDDRKNRPLSWTDIVYIVHTESGWRVDDIAYDPNLGNRGRLTRTLKSAIDEGNEFAK